MEHEILQLLRQSPGMLYSAKEIGRKIDRHQFRENANWARPFLDQLLQQKSIATDEQGYFFYPKVKKLGDDG